MRTKIKLGYFLESSHSKFDAPNNYYNKKLLEHFNIEIVDYKEADFVLFSEKKAEQNIAHKIPPKAIRIFLTGENERPNFNHADYALTHDYIDDTARHLRFPELRHWIYPDILKPRNFKHLSKDKTKFCNFMYSNPNAKERILFFKALSKYKKVDSVGKVLNNMGNTFIENKMDFINNYKFTIAFENSTYPGYSTEKLIQPLLQGSIPIYWGDTEIECDINPDCFINVHNFKSYEDVVDRITDIDKDDVLWEKYIKAPIFRNNVIPEHFKEEKFISFFREIFTSKKHQIPVWKKYLQHLSFNLNRLMKSS